MTHIYYHFIEHPLPGAVFEDKLSLFSKVQSEKIRSFRRWQDAHCSLMGNLLLLQGLNDFAITATLHHLRYNQYGKPYLPDCSVTFNISHAGNCVVCVLTDDTQNIGIDVEDIKDIDILEFKNSWTAHEWNEISNGEISTFYHYWTCKEAIIKADGRGLSIPLNQVEVRDRCGFYQDKVYSLMNVSLHPHYVISVASLKRLEKAKIIPVQI